MAILRSFCDASTYRQASSLIVFLPCLRTSPISCDDSFLPVRTEFRMAISSGAQALSAFMPAPLDNCSFSDLHPAAKTMRLLSVPHIRLIWSFHSALIYRISNGLSRRMFYIILLQLYLTVQLKFLYNTPVGHVYKVE
jgi:hypothetical protein